MLLTKQQLLTEITSNLGTQEERKIARFEGYTEGILLYVDTCAMYNSFAAFETAISYLKFNRGGWVIVQGYNTREQAVEGHEYWIKKLTTLPLPTSLFDVYLHVEFVATIETQESTDDTN